MYSMDLRKRILNGSRCIQVCRPGPREPLLEPLRRRFSSVPRLSISINAPMPTSMTT